MVISWVTLLGRFVGHFCGSLRGAALHPWPVVGHFAGHWCGSHAFLVWVTCRADRLLGAALDMTCAQNHQVEKFAILFPIFLTLYLRQNAQSSSSPSSSSVVGGVFIQAVCSMDNALMLAFQTVGETAPSLQGGSLNKSAEIPRSMFARWRGSGRQRRHDN